MNPTHETANEPAGQHQPSDPGCGAADRKRLASATRSRRYCRFRRCRVPRAITAALVLSASSLTLSAPAAALSGGTDEQVDQTEWLVVPDPEISGDPAVIERCDDSGRSHHGDCRFVPALGDSARPTHCSHWRVPGVRQGVQRILVYVPEGSSTNATYRVYSTDLITGEVIERAYVLERRLLHGWQPLTTSPTSARNVVIMVCNHETPDIHGERGQERLLGIDAVALRCVKLCKDPIRFWPSRLWADADSFEGATRIAWTDVARQQAHSEILYEAASRIYGGRGNAPEHPLVFPRSPLPDFGAGIAGYLVQYGLIGDNGRPASTSITYESVEPGHFGVGLEDGVEYQVHVWPVDASGRLGGLATTTFVHYDGMWGLEGPFDPEAAEEVSEDVRDLRRYRNALDLLGIFDPTPASDGASAAISAELGDQDEVWISAISMAPYIGDASKGYKGGKRAIEAANSVRKKLVRALWGRPSPVSELPGFKNAKIVSAADAIALYFRRANAVFGYRGYRYQTDEYGRTIGAWGPLKRSKPEFRSGEQFKEICRKVKDLGKKDKRGVPVDTCGHIMPKGFAGEGSPFNLFPQSSQSNQEFNAFFETWVNPAWKNTKDVFLDAQPRFDPGNHTMRPDRLEIKLWIEGRVKPIRKTIHND